MEAKIIKVNGTIQETKPANGKYFELAELQKIVGGYIQIINLRDGSAIVCDEEGKYKDYKINKEATNMAKDCLMPGDYIVGDVLVCEMRYL